MTPMNPLEFYLIVVFLLVGSFARFYVRLYWNKLLLCLISLTIVNVLSLSGAGGFTYLLYGLIVLLASYSFSWWGVFTSIGLIAASTLYVGELQMYFILALLGAGIAGELIFRQSRRKIASDNEWLTKLYKQSRHLSIVKEIGIAIQSTMEVEKLLHIILTAITAGYGLGFNRALLFLIDENDSLLKGEVGIGSMSEKEGISTWSRVVSRRMNLGDFIAFKHEAQFRDVKLIRLLRGIEIPVEHTDDHIFRKALLDRKPYIVQEMDSTDDVQRLLAECFQMTSFAVVPMLNQGKMLGVIVVDNNVNRKPLDVDDVDSMIPLAAQASVAIENSRLYERTQKMSITDGLTGLYNQRYYQEMQHKLLHEAEQGECSISLMIADIDYFKHYNDTNGHLEGNNALISVARIIADSVSGQHIPCRFGGEEFVVLLKNVSAEAARELADQIRSSVEQHPFYNREAQPSGKLTISVGMATFSPGMSVRQLQDLADSALYDAKRSGKNRVVAHEEGSIR